MAYKKLSAEEKRHRSEQRKREQYDREHQIIDGVIFKWCNHDNHWVVMNDENFSPNKSNSTDGYHNVCKICNQKRTKQWIKNNPEQYKKNEKKKYANPAPWRVKHNRELSKKQRENGYIAEYRKNNPEKIKGYSKNKYKNLHRITTQEWLDCKHYFANRCAYCGLGIEDHLVMRQGKLINMDLHREHVIHDGRVDLKNCVPACQSCNDKKWKFTLNEWYNKDNFNYTYERYHKIYMWLRYDHKKYIQKSKPKQKYERKSS